MSLSLTVDRLGTVKCPSEYQRAILSGKRFTANDTILVEIAVKAGGLRSVATAELKRLYRIR